MHEAWTDAATSRLLAAGYEAVDAGDDWPVGTRVLRRRDRRVGWFLSRLHTVVVLLPVDHATTGHVDRLTETTAGRAGSLSGRARRRSGNGIAVLPVVVSGTADEQARDEAAAPPRRRWAVIALPMLVEADTGRHSAYRGAITWGAVFQKFLAEQQRLVLGDPHADVLASTGRGRAGRAALLALLGVAGVLFLAAVLLLLL
ncbi:MAG: hypothetical protein EON53_07475 [Actinomycetales bacterium]|nr:MAG: hypothetical protein EON53_07475 [Actinomycetales bacterium]